MYLVNLRTGQTVSMNPKDYKGTDKFFCDHRPSEFELQEELSGSSNDSSSESSDSSFESSKDDREQI